MKTKVIFILILLVFLIGTIAATSYGVATPPETLFVFLKPSQAVLVVPALYCDEFIVEEMPDLTLKVTCRVFAAVGR